MSDIFISYSRKDITLARRIADTLAAQNLDIWIDLKSIPKGEDWEQEIYQGIEAAGAFLFLGSPDSVTSEMCNKEISHAAGNGKRILPVVMRDFEHKNIHSEISKRNWIFCREGQDDFDVAIEQIQSTFHTDFEWLKYHTKLQAKALDWERGMDRSRLLRGKDLREAEQKLAESSDQKEPQTTKVQRDYVLASRAGEERQRNQVITGLILGLIILAVVAIFAVIQRNEARRQARIARAGELAAQALVELERQPSLALLLSVEAHDLEDIWNTRNSLYTVAQSAANTAPAGQPLNGHTGAVTSVAFSPDGKTLASGSEDKTVRLWDVASAQPRGLPLTGHEAAVSDVAFSPSGSTLASSSEDRTIRLWDVASGELIGSPLIGHTDRVNSIAFSPDGKILASASGDHTVRLWEVASGQLLMTLTGHTGYVGSVAFSPNGKIIASAGQDNTSYTIRLWDADSGEALGTPLVGHTDWVTGVAFSPDGRLLASGSEDKTVRLWDVASRKPFDWTLWGDTDWVTGVAFSLDGETLASSSWDKTIRLWDVVTGRPLGPALSGHTDWVTSVAFSPDGKLIASGSEDKTVRLWFLGPAGWTEHACQAAGRNFTQSEWALYFPDEAYRITCPEWPQQS